LYCSCDHRALHSFPTRRSSDLESVGIAGYFDIYVFSDETGVAKPHPEAFRRAYEPLGCLPSEALHIGDIERTDILGAKSAGMKRSEEHTSELQSRENLVCRLLL